MDMNLPRSGRSFNGCWTCRLRRKKCDEARPVCDACGNLQIPCHYSQDKPEWMDGGARQEEMAAQVKREIKENYHDRRGKYTSGGPAVQIHNSEPISGTETPPKTPNGPQMTEDAPDASNSGFLSEGAREDIVYTQPDTILLMFYLENLLPFLFPFYNPSVLQGGRAWILEMLLSSPVVRQATLCQSAYFFSLVRGKASCDGVWELVLKQTRDAFGVLGKSLQLIDSSGITEHLQDAVRILTSIIQVQRFEIAILSFGNCHGHLHAALALLKQLLNNAGTIESAAPSVRFNAMMSQLRWLSGTMPSPCTSIPSTEQAAFSFSSSILILDDIIASTVLQEQPKLYEYHRSLLSSAEGAKPAVDLEAVVGCQNWTLLEIGEIAVLDAWKQRCHKAGNLNVMELVTRATAIKESLEAHLAHLESSSIAVPKEGNSLLDVFTAHYFQQPIAPISQSRLITRIWAHAALAYLFVVVSGWQPANEDVRYHVSRVIELLSRQLSPSALLRAVVWPFCVAGCLAEPAQEMIFRGMVERLQPPSVFGTVHKALEIMQNVWSSRDGDVASRDFATCFRSQGDLVLLV